MPRATKSRTNAKRETPPQTPHRVEVKSLYRLLIFNGCPPDLFETLAVPTICLDDHHKGFTRILRSSQPGYIKRLSGDGTYTIETCVGFLPDINRELREKGISLLENLNEVGDYHPFGPDGLGNASYPSVHRLIKDTFGGLIRYDGGTRRLLAILLEISKVFSNSRILIVATRRDTRNRVRNQFLRRGVAVVSDPRRDCQRGSVAVCTTHEVGSFVGFSPDFALHIDPDESVVPIEDLRDFNRNAARKLFLSQAPKFLFGFLPRDRVVRRNREGWLRGWYGEERAVIPAPRRVVLPLRYHFERLGRVSQMFPTKGSAETTNEKRYLDVQTQGLVRHTVRNQRIAGLARLLTKKPGRLSPRATDLERALGPWRGRRVAVLTDHVDHAAELASQLSWPVLSRCHPDDDPSDERVRALFAAGRENPGRHAHVVTLPGGIAPKHVPAFDVYVRADGGMDLPPWGKHVPSVADPVETPPTSGPLLIDIDDRHHPWLRRRAKNRRKAYVRARWTRLLPPGSKK